MTAIDRTTLDSRSAAIEHLISYPSLTRSKIEQHLRRNPATGCIEIADFGAALEAFPWSDGERILLEIARAIWTDDGPIGRALTTLGGEAWERVLAALAERKRNEGAGRPRLRDTSRPDLAALTPGQREALDCALQTQTEVVDVDGWLKYLGADSAPIRDEDRRAQWERTMRIQQGHRELRAALGYAE